MGSLVPVAAVEHHPLRRNNDGRAGVVAGRTAADAEKRAGTWAIAEKIAEEKRALNYSTSRDVLRHTADHPPIRLPSQLPHPRMLLLVHGHVGEAVAVAVDAQEEVVDTAGRTVNEQQAHLVPSSAEIGTHLELDTSPLVVHPIGDGVAVVVATVAAAACDDVPCLVVATAHIHPCHPVPAARCPCTAADMQWGTGVARHSVGGASGLPLLLAHRCSSQEHRSRDPLCPVVHSG